MATNRVHHYITLTSAFGATFGGLILFKEYLQGCRYSGDTRLVGKTVIVTGSNTGIGKETAKELAKRGAKVILACRDMEKCRAARKEIIKAARYYSSKQKEKIKLAPVICEELDLSSFESIRNFAAKISTEPRIDVLINNAASMRDPERILTKDGLEKQMGVNHFGHFLLTNLLLDKLKNSAPSRIVSLSSSAHLRGSIDLNNLNWEKDYDPGAAYNSSKLANVLFTRELARRLEGTGVTVNAVNPGLVYTDLFRNIPAMNSFSSIFLKPIMWLIFKTPHLGAQTTLHVVLDPEVTTNGAYFSNCVEAPVSEAAQDDELAKKLWVLSEKWTRLHAS